MKGVCGACPRHTHKHISYLGHKMSFLRARVENIMWFFGAKKLTDCLQNRRFAASTHKWMEIWTPTPKNVERDIYEYGDCKNNDTFFTTNLL